MLQVDLVSIWLIFFQEDLQHANDATLENNVHQFQQREASVKMDVCPNEILVIRQERRGVCDPRCELYNCSGKGFVRPTMHSLLRVQPGVSFFFCVRMKQEY